MLPRLALVLAFPILTALAVPAPVPKAKGALDQRAAIAGAY